MGSARPDAPRRASPRKRSARLLLLISAVLSLLSIFAPSAGAEETGAVFGWAERHPANAPEGRTNMAMAYDAAKQEVVLFGGYPGVGGSFFGDTWTWDGSDWTERTPATSPPPGSGVMAYDAKIGTIVYFGGGGTWTWDGSDWTALATLNTPPSGSFPVMAYDAAREELVLFVENALFEGETWTFDGSEWSQKAPAHNPPGRSLAGLTYDAARQQVVMVGGYHGAGAYFLSDTWTWDGSDWTERTPATVPSSQEGPSMAYDAALGESILFGGWYGAERFSDTWTWDGSEWTLRAPAVKPPGRFSAGMAYDEARGQVILFGGYPPAGSAVNPSDETWTYQRYRPPSATMAAPAGGQTFILGQSVATAFKCADEALAPGIASCQDSNGSNGSAGTLDTSRLGPHTYTVTALSKDGLGATASIGYTVVAPPQPPAPRPPLKLRIHYSPNHPHAPNRAGGPRYTFLFGGEAPGIAYFCRLDKRAFTPCRSPRVYRNLKPGRHVFRVKSVDPSGLESAVRKVQFRAGKPTPGAAMASAEGPELPEIGAWKGKTKQGFPVYFRVTEEHSVTNVRFTYREPVCGKQSPHDPTAKLEIDPTGHFGGAIYSGRLEFEGAFISPTRVRGKLIALATTGLPGCLREVVKFTAQPRG